MVYDIGAIFFLHFYSFETTHQVEGLRVSVEKFEFPVVFEFVHVVLCMGVHGRSAGWT